MKNHRNESMTSHRFYESRNVDSKLQYFMDTTVSVEQKNLCTKQSRHLPYWAWYMIAKCNGIPMQTDQKPILGILLNIFTFCVALVFCVSYTWYIVSDIISPSTPRDIADGTVSILLVLCWCAFGYYCKRLNSRLFCHRRFVKDVRLHSRTVFKINAAVLALLIGIAFSAANIYESTQLWNLEDCRRINLHFSVCYILSISSMAFTVNTLIWHTLISFAFISVCRTHTIGLRCFIKDIEHDSAMARNKHLSIYRHAPVSADDISQESCCWTEDEQDDIRPLYNAKESRENVDHVIQNTSTVCRHTGEIGILLASVSDNLEYATNDYNHGVRIDNQITGDSSSVSFSAQENNAPMENEMRMLAAENNSLNNIVHMSCSEILHNYWKLTCRLRFSSSAMQRWFASFMALVLLRCSTYLVHWLTHVATIFDILQFILPLTLLIVLSTALAEVNFEGQRFLRALYPLEERLRMLQFLSLNPLQMPIYGFGMTHGTIVTVVFAILVGFVTRIVITELTK